MASLPVTESLEAQALFDVCHLFKEESCTFNFAGTH